MAVARNRLPLAGLLPKCDCGVETQASEAVRIQANMARKSGDTETENYDLCASVVPTYETGVFLALNAIENSVMVMNSPRCALIRGMKVFGHHDLLSTVYSSRGEHRLMSTNWTRYEDVCGDETGFSNLLRHAATQHSSAWLFAFQNISSFASGFDLHGLVDGVCDETGARIISVDGPRLDGDWLDGYDEVLSKVLEWRLRGSDLAQVTPLMVAGHLFTRNEADEVANVAEIKRLLDALGIEGAELMLSGGTLPLTPLAVEKFALFPYAGARTRAVVARSSGVAADVELPIGIGGTVKWLEDLGRLTGKEESAAKLVERELQALIPWVQWIVPEYLTGRRALVVGDPHLVSGLLAFLCELGIEVTTSLVVTSHDRGRLDFPHCPNPSIEQFVDCSRPGSVDFAIGNGVFAPLSQQCDLPYIEIGYPSYLTHALYERPFLGFAGARCIIDSIFNTLLRKEERSSGHAP